MFVEHAVQQVLICLDACNGVIIFERNAASGLLAWFCWCLQHTTVFCTPTVAVKWWLPPEKISGNEDRAECVRVPCTPHAKPSEPQQATKCVFNLLNQMAR